MQGFTEGIISAAVAIVAIGAFAVIAYVDYTFAGLLAGVVLIAVGMNVMLDD